RLRQAARMTHSRAVLRHRETAAAAANGAKRRAFPTPDWLAEHAVRCEPVSTTESLLTGKRTGNLTKIRPLIRFLRGSSRWCVHKTSSIPGGYKSSLGRRAASDWPLKAIAP